MAAAQTGYSAYAREERAPESFWISLRYFNFYRIAVAAVFLGTALIYDDTLGLGANNLTLFRYVSAAYFLLGVVFLGVLLLAFTTEKMHHIEVPWVALAILFSLLMFNFLETRDFRQRIDWTFLIFLGALVGLVKVMQFVGLDDWLAHHLQWLSDIMIHDFGRFVLLLAAAIFVVRLALPINATVVIFATLLVPTATANGVNPWLVGFLVLLLSENFIWSYQASYYLQFCSLVGPSAQAEDRRVILLNALGFLMKLAAIYASFPFWRQIGIV